MPQREKISFPDGGALDPILWGEESYFPEDKEPQPCHDCGAEIGEQHQLGCDMEQCPRCGGQYFLCDCETAEKLKMWEDHEEGV